MDAILSERTLETGFAQYYVSDFVTIKRDGRAINIDSTQYSLDVGPRPSNIPFSFLLAGARKLRNSKVVTWRRNIRAKIYHLDSGARADVIASGRASGTRASESEGFYLFKGSLLCGLKSSTLNIVPSTGIIDECITTWVLSMEITFSAVIHEHMRLWLSVFRTWFH